MRTSRNFYSRYVNKNSYISILIPIGLIIFSSIFYFGRFDNSNLLNELRAKSINTVYSITSIVSSPINLIKNGTISGKIAKTIFELMLDGDIDPQIIVEEKGLKQESDPKALEALIDKIINDNREKAIEYKQGKEKLFGFFVGQAMKASGGKANPQLINEILKKKL